MSTDGKVGKSWEEFFKASNTKTIKYMADSVKYVKCDKSFAPIHIPAIEGELDIFKYVYNISKNKEETSRQGYTAQHWAAYIGHKKICNFLMNNIIFPLEI